MAQGVGLCRIAQHQRSDDSANTKPCQGADLNYHVKPARAPIASDLLCAPGLLPRRLPVLALA